MKYHQHVNHRRRQRIRRRRKIVAFVVIVLVVIGALFVAYENYQAENFNSEDQTTSAATSSYVAPNIEVFRSPYFQFQTNRSWSEDPGSSTGNKYSYRSMRGNLLEHTMTIYVNSAPSDVRASRVLAATLNGNRGLKVEKISDHCGKATTFKDSSFPVTLEKVPFTCFGDDTRYNVVVGLIGSGTEIKLPRPDGTTVAYTIYYSNVTASPDASQLTEIVNSFQTR